MIKVESNIPPPTTKRRTFVAKYPWHYLDVGQSFLVKDGKFRSMQAGCSLAGKRHGRKYIARVVDGGVRVWRMA